MNISSIKIIRPVNLSIIIVTIVAMRFLIVEPLSYQLGSLIDAHIAPALGAFELTLLILSVLFIAAGGYIINDIADVEIDRINKPGRNIIGRQLSAAKAMKVYYVLTAAGLAAGVYLGVKVWNYNLALLHVAVAVSLYFYAFYFKKSFLLGNIITAFAVASVPLVYGIYEIIPMQDSHLYIREEHPNFNLNFMAYWILGFSAFAFLITLAREITKDAEDIEGDKTHNAKTLPAVIGIAGTKIVIAVIYLACIALLARLHLNYLPDRGTLIYFSILALLFLLLLILSISATRKTQFSRASALNKLTAIIGLGYSAIVAYMMYNDQLL